jgi:hypothetical protein
MAAAVFAEITDTTVLEALACCEALALADDSVLRRFLVASD